MDRIYLIGTTLTAVGALLMTRAIRILWRGRATLADALPIFGLLGRIFFGSVPLKGGWARAASIPLLLLSLTSFTAAGSLVALKHFKPEALDLAMLSITAKHADQPSAATGQTIITDTIGQVKCLLTGHSGSPADASVTVPEADLGPISITNPADQEFRSFTETPGKLSVVVFQLPQGEEIMKLRAMIERVGRRFSNVAQVAYFDLDVWPELGEAQGVTQFPDVRFYRDGRKVDGFVGLPVKDVVLLEKFTRHSHGLAGANMAAAAESPAGAGELLAATPPALRMPTPAVRELTDQNFKEFISQPDCLAVVVYSADWCPACAQLKPLLKAVAAENSEVMEVGCVNVDRVSAETKRRGTTKIPVIHYYLKGKRIGETVGRPSLADLRAYLDEATRGLRAERAEAAKAHVARPSTEPVMAPMKKGWMPAGLEKK